MGVSGLTPFDSDDFGDMFANVASGLEQAMSLQVGKELAKAKRSRYVHEKWAAVGLVIWAYNTGIRFDEFNHFTDQALAFVDELENDGEWLDSWRAGTNIQKHLEAAKEILADMRGRHESPALPYALHDLFPEQRVPRARKRRYR